MGSFALVKVLGELPNGSKVIEDQLFLVIQRKLVASLNKESW
jgi:hypothetical protein